MGSTYFRKLQFGKETTKGTAVAADTMIAHAEIPPVSPDSIVHRPSANLGSRSESILGHSYIGQKFWQQTLTINNAYFQILPLLGSLGIIGGLTPAEQTASQNDMLWDFDPSLTAANALDAMTLEMGDDDQAYEVEYVMMNRLRIAGTVNQAQEVSISTIEADLFGRQVSPVSFTGGLSVPSTDLVNAKMARLYKDSAWADLGNTELPAVLRGFDVEFADLAHAKHLGSADKFFTEHGQGMIASRMMLTLERGSESDATWDDFRAVTGRAVRLEIDSGVQIGTGVNHKLTVDMIGTFDPVTPMSSDDRSNLIDVGDLVSEEDQTSGKRVRMQVITDVAAI